MVFSIDDGQIHTVLPGEYIIIISFTNADRKGYPAGPKNFVATPVAEKDYVSYLDARKKIVCSPTTGGVTHSRKKARRGYKSTIVIVGKLPGELVLWAATLPSLRNPKSTKPEITKANPITDAGKEHHAITEIANTNLGSGHED